MSKCKEIQKHSLKFIKNELPIEVINDFKAHINGCESCREFISFEESIKYRVKKGDLENRMPKKFYSSLKNNIVEKAKERKKIESQNEILYKSIFLSIKLLFLFSFAVIAFFILFQVSDMSLHLITNAIGDRFKNLVEFKQIFDFTHKSIYSQAKAIILHNLATILFIYASALTLYILKGQFFDKSSKRSLKLL